MAKLTRKDGKFTLEGDTDELTVVWASLKVLESGDLPRAYPAVGAAYFRLMAEFSTKLSVGRKKR